MSRRRKTTYVGYFPNRHSFARAARDKSSWVYYQMVCTQIKQEDV